MKTETKFWSMMAGVIILTITYQIKFGNNASLSLLVTGIMLFSIGFGYYGGLLRKAEESKR